jgi:hypothetical protein
MTIAITAPMCVILVAVAPRLHNIRFKTTLIKGSAGNYLGLKPESIVITCAL